MGLVEMTKESMWDSNTVKAIAAIASILTIIVSVLTILDYFGKIDLRTPISNFFGLKVSILSILIASILLVLIVSLVFWFSKRRKVSNILDFEDGRVIARLCAVPRTTEFLKQQYSIWDSQNRSWVGGYGFDDYMKRLEKQKFLTYNSKNGTWTITQKAIEYIVKYHGH
jgi:hypothetical protein